jgi:putative serine protease XkdF
MPKELTNVKADFISILTDDITPANRKGVIVKSENGDQSGTFEIFAKLEKFDDIKGFLYVTPMVAVEKDTDDEFYANETVQKTAHDTLKNAIIKAADVDNPIDTNHSYKQLNNVYLVESHVDKSEDDWEWRAVLDIHENEELMQKARDGLINGVSIAGTCNKIPVAEVTKDKKIKHFEDRINDWLEKGKSFDERMEDKKNTDIYNPLNVANEAIYNIVWEMNKDIPAMKKAIKEVLKQFGKYVDKMSFKVKTEKKEGEEMKLTDEQKVEISGIVTDAVTKSMATFKDEIVLLIPKAPVVKNDEGEEVAFDIIGAIASLVKEVKAIKDNPIIKSETVNERIAGLEKELTDLKKQKTESNQAGENETEMLNKGSVSEEDDKAFEKSSLYV